MLFVIAAVQLVLLHPVSNVQLLLLLLLLL
jgi:hypothetical protein